MDLVDGRLPMSPVGGPTAMWIRAALDELRGLLITIFILKGHDMGRETGRKTMEGFQGGSDEWI